MQFLEEIKYNWMDLLPFWEKPFRAKLIPSKVWKDLDRYKNNKRGLANYCRKWKTKIEWKPVPSTAKMYQTYVAIGGEYDVSTHQVILQLYTKNFNSHNFTQESWDKFKYRFIQTLMHELIHFMQYHRRCDEDGYRVAYKKVKQEKKNAERQYLSNFDEIQAYAHCVYLDFKTYRGDHSIEDLLSRAHKIVDSKTLHYFLKTFDYDYKNNQAVSKIMYQVMKWDKIYQRMHTPK